MPSSKFMKRMHNYQGCDALQDLIPFVQFKKREKHPWRNVTFCNFNKSNTPPWLFFTLLNTFLNCINGTKLRKTSHI